MFNSMKYLVMVVMFSLLLVGSSAMAKGKGSKGSGKSKSPGWNKGGVKGLRGNVLPKGWEEGKPAGWTKGEKKGWEGADGPPGLEKKEGGLPPGLEKKSPAPTEEGAAGIEVNIKIQETITQQKTERKKEKGEKTRHSLD